MTTAELAHLETQLVHAVTAYDRRQSKRRDYNRWALPQCLQRVEEVIADIRAGAGPREAIVAGFLGRLQDACLRECGLAIASEDEQAPGIVYQPVSVLQLS